MELVSNASEQLFSDKTLSSFTKFFAGATESGKSMGGCNFGNILPINVPKSHSGKIQVFSLKNSNFLDFTIRNPVSTIP